MNKPSLAKSSVCRCQTSTALKTVNTLRLQQLDIPTKEAECPAVGAESVAEAIHAVEVEAPVAAVLLPVGVAVIAVMTVILQRVITQIHSIQTVDQAQQSLAKVMIKKVNRVNLVLQTKGKRQVDEFQKARSLHVVGLQTLLQNACCLREGPVSMN